MKRGREFDGLFRSLSQMNESQWRLAQQLYTVKAKELWRNWDAKCQYIDIEDDDGFYRSFEDFLWYEFPHYFQEVRRMVKVVGDCHDKGIPLDLISRFPFHVVQAMLPALNGSNWEPVIHRARSLSMKEVKDLAREYKLATA